jgi:hypothetical protein
MLIDRQRLPGCEAAAKRVGEHSARAAGQADQAIFPPTIVATVLPFNGQP